MSTPDNEEFEPRFDELMALLREGLPDEPTEKPGEGVWSAIAAELGPPFETGQLGGAGEASAPSLGGPPPSGEVVRDIASARSSVGRSWGRPLALLTAAAAVLLVAVPLYLAVGGDGGGGGGVDLRAQLEALPGYAATGEAEVDDRELTVHFEGSEAPESAYYELWLLDIEDGAPRDLVSIGQIEVAVDGTFELPDGVDLSRFDVVDISVEPDDGDPTHSGDSVVRGTLTSA